MNVGAYVDVAELAINRGFGMRYEVLHVHARAEEASRRGGFFVFACEQKRMEVGASNIAW
jgi:hypothetical protein